MSVTLNASISETKPRHSEITICWSLLTFTESIEAEYFPVSKKGFCPRYTRRPSSKLFILWSHSSLRQAEWINTLLLSLFLQQSSSVIRTQLSTQTHDLFHQYVSPLYLTQKSLPFSVKSWNVHRIRVAYKRAETEASSSIQSQSQWRLVRPFTPSTNQSLWMRFRVFSFRNT